MASPCCVKNCINIGTHRFPKDEARKAQWIQAIKHLKPGLTIRKHSLICSAHFRRTDFAVTPTCFTKLGHSPKVLRRNAKPSIFPWNKENKASQEWPSLSSSLIFDPSKVQATYSRTPPIQFVEMQPFVNTHTEEIEDPLQLETVCQQTEMDENNVIVEALNLEEDPQQTEGVNLCLEDVNNDNIIEIVIGNQSVQTQTEEDRLKIQQQNIISVHTQTMGIGNYGFSIYNYKDDDKSLHFYTGLENFKKILLVFYSLGNSAQHLNYFYGVPPENLDPLEQFFITLVILRRHKTFQEITMLYKIALKHVYTIFITWIRFMSLQWRNLDIWVDREKVTAFMPLDFHEKYPATRVIIDATECPIKKPKLPLAQQITFSTYKNRNTAKFLIGITPGGLINYVSPAYGGSATDRQIIERSPILNKFNYNDEIMVDKGLNVQDIFVSYGVKVNMPAFFRKGNQIESETLKSNRKVASKRVHIERVIGMLKTYRILTQPMNQTEILLCSDIVFVIAMLVNFRSNIINKNA